MSIGVSPFTPTSLDRRQDRRNPKEPWLDRDGRRLAPEAHPDPAEERLDRIEEAVPPLAPNK